MLQIRAEKTPDRQGIRTVLLAAFAPRTKEADLVDGLREAGQSTIALVAISDGQLAGHVLFSPVSLTPPVANLRGLGLAPLAVNPEFQKKGIGTRLAMRGIEVARGADYDYLVVLGDPKYYSRFGFRPGNSFGLENEYRAQDEFMALELRTGALVGVAGLVRYRPEFKEFDC